MTQDYDLILRNGCVYDGLGNEGFTADVAVRGTTIAAIGDLSGARAAEEIDATGCIVTPGFVDVHTHYDGQSVWSSSLGPSSAHGVTTAVLGNCGVGFAPCRPEDRELLVSVMEGVEDIPEVVMTAGLTWDWESFPDYLEVIAARPHDLDVAAYVPHSALRVYVMGERGARREAATPEDRRKMAALVGEAIEAGAIGFSTGSVPIHRTSAGDFIPTFGVAEEELAEIAREIRRRGKGVMQILVDLTSGPVEPGMAMLKRMAETTRQPVTFSLAQVDSQPQAWREVLELLDDHNSQPDVDLKGQVFPRPVGVFLGHDVTLNPFRLCPSYEAIANLPLADKVRALRDPEMRARLLSEVPQDPTQPLFLMGRAFNRMFELGDPPNYEQPLSQNIANRAAAMGITPEELAYDLMLEQDGRALLYVAIANYTDGNLEPTLTMMRNENCILGLGDGGAHYGLICDASFPTFVLTHWVRDREGERLDLAQAIRALSAQPAEAVGLRDRGRIAVGYKADLNVIDFNRLALHGPHVVRDLPSDGRRILQAASGYVATVLSGRITQREDQPTGVYPGGLVRGPQAAPVV